MKTIGANLNITDVATLSSAISLNTSTSVLVQASNIDRIYFSISSPDSHAIWLKLQAASVDNDKKGIYIPKNGFWEMQPDDKYTGEICAIADTGTPSVYTTEY